MNKYECIFIAEPNADEEKIDSIIETISSKVNVSSIEKKGLRDLAYEIRGNKKGYFVIVYFNSSTEESNELEGIIKKIEEIMKFIILKVED